MAETLDWLKFELAKGLTTLTLLRLKNAPPVDAAEETIEVWFRTLTFRKAWDEKLDRARFAEAFLVLAQSCDTFPSPKQVLEAMKPREIIALPEPEITPEQREKAAMRWRELKRQMESFKCTVKKV